MSTLQKNIFKKSSRTFYYSTLFFPKHIQKDVYKLYAFVRTADDFVDTLPQDAQSFYNFRDQSLYYLDVSDETSSDFIISGFVEIYKKYHFKRDWVVSFLSAMESDLWDVSIKTQKELEEYMYGSAAVVGYMMCSLFSIKDWKYLEAAKIFAYSLQTINFVRDIDEDNLLWRRYLYDTAEVRYNWCVILSDDFPKFIHAHIYQYYNYLKEASSWLNELPLSFRIAVLTASQIYSWTAYEIEKNPQRVFKQKIKPSKLRVILYGVYNIIVEPMKSFVKMCVRQKIKS